MRQLVLIIGVIISVIIFFACQQESAFNPVLSQSEKPPVALVKPAPNLIGKINCNFSFTPPTFWNGTIEFAEGEIYGITFVSLAGPVPLGQSSHFEEELIVYELGTDWRIAENVYLKGWNVGVVINANRPPDPVKFHENGKITEAYGPFEGWLDRNIHSKGTVYWESVGVPERAEATLRLN